jgi:hypothetical protein
MFVVVIIIIIIIEYSKSYHLVNSNNCMTLTMINKVSM